MAEVPEPDDDDTYKFINLPEAEGLEIDAIPLSGSIPDRTQVSGNGKKPKNLTRPVLVNEHVLSYRSGPLPDPETLRQLKKIHPSAPRTIFSEFKKQGEHRRAMERLVVESNIAKERYGQGIAGGLVAITLIGSLILLALGKPLEGLATIVGTLATLATVFMYGKWAQNKELAEKSNIQKHIKEACPIKQMDASSRRFADVIESVDDDPMGRPSWPTDGEVRQV